ncbi:hypothetical protein LTR78_007280 [Recurvomyces mirabilis]|uniref:DUF7605 domain-containing protein n=1 Tax=Recurvomyces mirabilis TaxID=574656 RepID=A0AAE0WJM3_9PEZI|nr:hypothetical protein LTR78_007280 [Recurvomyces mirabilis]KAK5155478.1 hypothetical protein LTS14_005739 [Recurvomyces mirabilis]
MLVFLKNLQLWVKTTTIDRRRTLILLAKMPLDKLDGRLDARVTAFDNGIDSFLTGPLRQRWTSTRQTALDILTKKRQKHSSTLRAFIRRNGNHSTQLCPKESWNEQFIKGITNFISEHWEEFESSKAAITEQLNDALARDMRAILPAMSRDHPSSMAALPVDRLEELVEAQISALNNIFRSDMYPYSQGLRNIKMDATHDSDANYFSRSITPVYRNCKLDSGAGVTKRSMDKIETHLSKKLKDSPFITVEHRLAKALRKNDEKHVRATIKDKTTAIFESLYGSFDRLIDKTVEDPREKRARQDLMKVLPALEKSYKEAVKTLEQVKAKYEIKAENM